MQCQVKYFLYKRFNTLYNKGRMHLVGFTLFIFSFFSLLLLTKAEYEISCSNIDYIYSNSQCCNENNNARCVKKMPHLEYKAHIASLETKLEELGLCTPENATCIMDFPAVQQLTEECKALGNGGLEIAMELAKSSQQKSDILTGFSGGIIPTMTAEAGTTITLDSTSFMFNNGTAEFVNLNVDNLVIDNILIDNVITDVDFGNHVMTNVNLDSSTIKIDDVAMNANANELNVLVGVDSEVTSTELNMLRNLDINVGDLNVLKNVSSDLDGVALSRLAGLDVNPGDLNVLKNVSHELDSTALNKLVGLQVDAATLNIFKGADPELTSTHLNNVKGLTSSPEEMNILTGVNPLLSSNELNMLVGLDINPGDLNVLKGIDPNLNSGDLNKIVGLTADAGDLNVLHGIDNTITIEELNRLVGLTSDSSELNILDGVDSNLGHEELNLLVGLDINSVADLNALKGVSNQLNKDHLNNIKGLTSSTAELNVLDGIDTTITSTELNLLKGLETDAAQLNIMKDVDTNLGYYELNQLVGLDINRGDLNVLKGVDHALDKDDLNKIIGITTTADELNVLQGIDTAISKDEWDRLIGLETDSAQLNILKGVSTNLDKTELNRLVGLDINPGDLNVLRGVDQRLSKTELDKLVGLVVTSSELNELDHGNGKPLSSKVTGAEFQLINDITTMGQTQNSKAVTTDASGNVQFNGDVEIDGDLDIPNGQLKLQGVNLDVTVTASIINDATAHFNQLTATVDEINSALDGIQATATELNLLHGATATTAEFNRLDIPTAGETTANKVVTTDSSGNVKFNNKVHFDAQVNAKNSFKINNVLVTSTASELNILDGVSTGLSTAELNYLDLSAATPGATENSKVVTADSSGNVKFNGHVNINNQDLKVNKDKLKIGNVAVTTTAAELNVLDGIAADLTVTELNVLDGVTATTADLNVLASLAAAGVTTNDLNMLRGVGSSSANTVANRALVTDNSGNVNMQVLNVNEIDIPKDKLKIANVAVTATAAELNVLDGVDTTITVTELNTLKDLTATSAELNVLDGVNVTTADINMLKGVSSNDANNVAHRVVVTDGTVGGHVKLVDVTVTDTFNVPSDKLLINNVAVTASAADINKLDGMTSSKEELNIMTGVTVTTTEINTLHGITSTADDINMLNGLHANRTNIAADKVVVLDSNGDVTLPNVANINIAEVDTLKLHDGNSYVKLISSAAELNELVGLTSTSAELNVLNHLTATPAELNIMDGVTSSTEDINMLKGTHGNRANDVPDRVVVLDNNGDVTLPGVATINTADITTLKLYDGSSYVEIIPSVAELNALQGLTSTNTELNILNHLTATPDELNIMDGVTSTTDDINLLTGTHANRANDVPDRVAVLDGNGDVSLPGVVNINTANIENLKLYDGSNYVEITASAQELNALVGITSTSTELNILDGVVATTDEINIMDGVTSTTNDINMLEGTYLNRANNVPNRVVVLDDEGNLTLPRSVKMTAADVTDEFKIKGVEVTVTAQELNAFSGLDVPSERLNVLRGSQVTTADIDKLITTATTDDLNLLTGLAANRSNANPDRAVVLDSEGNLLVANDMIADHAEFNRLYIDGVELLVVPELNNLRGLLSTTEELNALHNMTASYDELNLLDGATVSTEDINILTGLYAGNRTNKQPGKAVVFKDNGNLELNNDLRVKGNLNVDNMYLNGIKLDVTALELNTLNGILADVDELNIMHGVNATTSEINKLSGMTSTTEDLNLLQGLENDRSNANPDRAVVLDMDGLLTLPNRVNINEADIDTLKLNGDTVTTSADRLNILTDISLNFTHYQLKILQGATVTTDELNTLDGILSSVEDLNLLEGRHADRSNSVPNRAVVTDDNGNLVFPGIVNATGTLDVNTFKMDGVEVVSNATEINILDGILVTTEELNTLVGVDPTFTETDLDILVGFNGDSTDLNRLYDIGTCRDPYGSVTTEKTNTACTDATFCADVNEVVGNGAAFSDKVTCESNSVCGEIVKNQQCIFTRDNIYTDESICSDDSNKSKTDCLAIGTCAADNGNVGNGASYNNDKTACEASTDCGDAVSNKQCVFTEYVWSVTGNCTDSTYDNQEAECLAQGSCSDSTFKVGNGASHTDKATCNAKSDCGDATYNEQCVHTSSNAWRAGSCYDHVLSVDHSDTYDESTCENIGTCTVKEVINYCVKNEDAIWDDEIINGMYDAGNCIASDITCDTFDATADTCTAPYEDGGILKPVSSCCKIIPADADARVGGGAVYDNNPTACNSATVCGLTGAEQCEHTKKYSWNPAHCELIVDSSETQCATAEFPQGRNCGIRDGYFWDGNTWQFQLLNAVTQAQCLDPGTCAASDGQVGNGGVHDNDKSACNDAAVCGGAKYTESCVWHQANTYTDTSSCSVGDADNQAACIAGGTCAAANGEVGNGDSYSTAATCNAATDCGVPTSNSQCVFTQSNTWEVYGTCQYNGCSDSSDKNEDECTAIGTCSATVCKRDATAIWEDSGNNLYGSCADTLDCSSKAGTTDDCIDPYSDDNSKACCKLVQEKGNGDAHVNDKDACLNATDCGEASPGGHQCLWTPDNTWYDVGTCSNPLYHNMQDACTSDALGYCNDNTQDRAGCSGTYDHDNNATTDEINREWKLNTFDPTPSCSNTSYTDETTCLETEGTCAAADGQAGNGGNYITKTTCNSQSDQCGRSYNTQCEFTQTHVWQPVLEEHDANESSCLIPGDCSSVDGIDGDGSMFDNNETYCNAAKVCGPNEATDACIWHEFTWAYEGTTKANKAIVTDNNGDITFTETVTVNTLDIIGHTAETPKLSLNGVDIAVDVEDLNLLSEVNISTDELKYLTIDTLGQTEASKVVTTDANGNVKFNDDVTIEGVMTVDDITVGGVAISEAAKQHIPNLEKLNDMTVKQIQEFNSLDKDAMAAVQLIDTPLSTLNKLANISISPSQQTTLNNIGLIDNLRVLTEVDNFIALDYQKDAVMNDLTVKGNLVVENSWTGTMLNCHKFIETGSACRNDGTDHLLFNPSNNEVYLCSASNMKIKISYA